MMGCWVATVAVTLWELNKGKKLLKNRKPICCHSSAENTRSGGPEFRNSMSCINTNKLDCFPPKSLENQNDGMLMTAALTTGSNISFPFTRLEKSCELHTGYLSDDS